LFGIIDKSRSILTNYLNKVI